MKVSFEGIGEQVVSFAANGEVKGAFVKMSSNGTVAACSAAENFMGYCINAEDGFADVQTHGYITCPYTGTAPHVGYNQLTADANGKVKTAQTGREYLVLDVDTTANTLGFIM
ncbi:MAG: hypothetical protein Q4A83_00995 [Bacillota bacterium]|nr:hypothetical protein [Bacillota bacterium]